MKESLIILTKRSSQAALHSYRLRLSSNHLSDYQKIQRPINWQLQS